MNAFWALIPVLLIRYLLLGALDNEALKRAAHYPVMVGFEKTAYWIYQIATVLLFVYLFFLKITPSGYLFYLGISVYGLGIVVSIFSTIIYAQTEKNSPSRKGLYRISRNPMYIGYFLCFVGCVLMTHSLILLVILIVFQISAHWIILAEEHWCVKEFGEEYIKYMQKVRRYL